MIASSDQVHVDVNWKLHMSLSCAFLSLLCFDKQLRRNKHPLNMLVSLTVGKVDAGVAVLLTEDKRLVRLPYSFPVGFTKSASQLFINLLRKLI